MKSISKNTGQYTRTVRSFRSHSRSTAPGAITCVRRDRLRRLDIILETGIDQQYSLSCNLSKSVTTFNFFLKDVFIRNSKLAMTFVVKFVIKSECWRETSLQHQKQKYLIFTPLRRRCVKFSESDVYRLCNIFCFRFRVYNLAGCGC
jgi:hypothetical protein